MAEEFTAQEKHRAVLRELEMRKAIFPRLVRTGTKTKNSAQREIAIFEAIAADYAKLVEKERKR